MSQSASTFGFLSREQVWAIRKEFGTPVYVYDRTSIEARAKEVLSFPAPYGLTARYAMKALSTAAILQLFTELGVHIDASSGFEAERAMKAGVPPDHIQLTAQQVPDNLGKLVEQGLLFNACSKNQLERYGQAAPGTKVSVRINPGLGSGHNNRTNVGGPSSSFGIWHEYIPELFEVAAKYKLTITGLHSHIGSGGDPEVWKRCAVMTLNMAERLPDVTRVNLGGGFKVGRMPGEPSADLKAIGEAVASELEKFAKKHGRELHLELEPGTYLSANMGAIVASVIDVVDTGKEGRRFVKVDTGMTEILRPSMYGAQHPMWVVKKDDSPCSEAEFLVAGHCCESGDILTPEPGNPEGLHPRTFPEPEIGDAFVVGGTGAYCSAQPAKNYNSFPEAPEVLIERDGTFRLIRRRQTLEQVVENEVIARPSEMSATR